MGISLSGTFRESSKNIRTTGAQRPKDSLESCDILTYSGTGYLIGAHYVTGSLAQKPHNMLYTICGIQ